MNILIADDHSIVRSGLKILISKDFIAEIDEAADDNEVTDLIKKKKYELAILDINMPNTNSPQLIEYIAQIFQGKNKVVLRLIKEGN